MNSKDLIKYGLLALGAYLIWKYIEDNGGLSNVLGTGTTTALPLTTGTTAAITAPAAMGTATQPVSHPTTQPVSTAPPTPAAVAMSQQVLAAATGAGEPNSLNMDQWCYYYAAISGAACPVDPGTIPASVYSGAGATDRTTLIPVSTWLAIMQNQAPQLGLTGMGAFSIPMGTPAWMVM